MRRILLFLIALVPAIAMARNGPGLGDQVLASNPAVSTHTGATAMYGLIGKMKAVPGQREALVAILLDGVSDMPGCLSYVVALDPADPDALWVTEVWDSEASHKASLSLPSVKEAIARGKPLIAAFEQYIQTVPVGGHGLEPSSHGEFQAR